jgi:hypothetical protein
VSGIFGTSFGHLFAMTDIHQDTETSRQKFGIGVPKHQKKISEPSKKKGGSFLPPMTTEDGSHSRAGSNSSSNGGKKHVLVSHMQLEAAEATVDRLRVLLREKEIEVGKLRSENSTLRQVIFC